ncbi:MAG: XRE family transcriptional regulator [Bacteroidales bacterium]|nr:XRE family transcriptional regulator [Bacteroidales bacterium]
MAENNNININIGMAIREELKRQERSVAWFARKLGTSRMACYRIFESYSIDTYMLLKISRALNHDFFALYSDSMKCEEIM